MVFGGAGIAIASYDTLNVLRSRYEKNAVVYGPSFYVNELKYSGSSAKIQ